VLADRTRPMDFEVHQVESVTGYGSGPMRNRRSTRCTAHATRHRAARPEQAFYQVRREPRVMSQRQRARGPRSSYVGSETFIAIVDAAEAPYRHNLRQLGLNGVVHQPRPAAGDAARRWQDRFHPRRRRPGAGYPRAGRPQPAAAFLRRGEYGLAPDQPAVPELPVAGRQRSGQGAHALRELLALYCHPLDARRQRQVEGVRSIASKPITRRMPTPGPITFGRGLEITVTMDDGAFEGAGAFVLGAC
jgi:type VI secretion system protein ImpG